MLAIESATCNELITEFSGLVKQLPQFFNAPEKESTCMDLLFPLFVGTLHELRSIDKPEGQRFYTQFVSLFSSDPAKVAKLRALNNGGGGRSIPPRSFHLTINEEEYQWLTDALEMKESFYMTMMFDRFVKLTVEQVPPEVVPTERFGELLRSGPSDSTSTMRELHYMRTNLNALASSPSSEPPLHAHFISVPNSVSRFTSAAISPDRRLLACGAENSALCLRPLDSGAFLSELPLHSPRGVSRLHLAREQCLQVGGRCEPRRDYRAKNEVASGVRWLRGHRGPVTEVCFLGQARYLLSTSLDHTVRMWDAVQAENLSIYDFHNNPVLACDVSPPLSMFASGAMDALCHLWATDRSRPLRTFVGHDGPVQDVQFHPNSKSLATCSDNDGLRLWDVGSGRMVVHIAHRLPTIEDDPQATLGFRRIAWSPNGTHAVLLGCNGRRRGGPLLKIYDLRYLMEPACSLPLANPPAPCRPAWSIDGSTLVLASRDAQLHLWWPFREGAQQPRGDAPDSVRVASDRRALDSPLAVTCYEDSACYLVGQPSSRDFCFVDSQEDEEEESGEQKIKMEHSD